MIPRASEPRILARRHPLAILGLHTFQLLTAALLAWPVSAALGRGIGHHPGGDAALFQPGGLLLVESLRLEMDTLAVLLPTASWQLVLAGFAGLVPLAATMHALASERPLGPRGALSSGVRSLPAFAALGGISLFVRAVAIVAVLWAGVMLRAGLTPHLGERSGDLAFFTAIGAVVPLTMLIEALEDLGRAQLVRGDVPVLDAVRRSIGTVCGAPLGVLLDWLAPTIASMATLVASAAALRFLALDRPGAPTTLGLWLLLELAALAQVGFRAIWLAAALRRATPAGAPIEASRGHA